MPLIPLTPENIIRWSDFTAKVRGFFQNKGFLEVNTPNLVSEGAFESAINPLKVSWKGGSAELHTSPEICMKEFLCLVKRPIFQICKCFRDDWEGPHHAREFSMLEFYQPGANYTHMIDLVRELIEFTAGTRFGFLEKAINPLFEHLAGINLAQMQSTAAFRMSAEKAGFRISDSDSWEDIFFRIMIERIEPSLDPKYPTFVTNYPLSVSPLSQARSNTASSGPDAERFELYWQGREICNGCTELTDAGELKRRHQLEADKRIQAGKEAHPFSERLFNATSKLGPTAGVAIGLDRLFLCLYSSDGSITA